MREDQSDMFMSQSHDLMAGEAKVKSGTIVSCSGSSIDDSNRLWMLEAEVAALQKDLDHERSVRRLEARRVESMEKRWKSQMEFLVAEEMESRQLLEEMNRRNEADLEIAQNARREAVERCTQAEQKVASLLMDHSSNEEGALLLERNKRRILETKCATLQKEVESLQTIIKESSQASSTTELIHTDDSLNHNAQKKRKLSTDVPLADDDPSDDASALRKERDELKVQLAQTQRSNRQWIRKANETSKRANEALHYQQAAQRTQEKLEDLQKERDQLVLKTQQYSLVQDQWAGFAQTLRAHSQDLMDKQESINKQDNDQQKTNAAPPEIASVLRHIQSLKDKNQNLLTLLDSTNVKSQASQQHITNLERTVQRNQLANETLEATNKAINQTLKQTEDQLKTIQAQESIWKKEASSMRTLLDTYEHMERNLTSPNKSSSALDETSSSTDIKTSASTASLQLSLDSTKEELQLLVERNRKLLEEKDAMLKQANADKEEHERVLSKFEKLKKALFAEREKSQKAEERATEAETLAGKGSYNSETTKVLHLQTNPLTTAIHQKYKLEISQLERTIEGLQNQQQQSSSNASTTPPSSSVNASKLHQRLKNQFREQIASYREGVYLLTGYKIEMQMEQTQPIFKVRSMYSDQEEDHLLFSWAEKDGDGKLDILSTDMAKIFYREPSFEYVTKFNSIPAFLASVNLSLFEKQTFVS